MNKFLFLVLSMLLSLSGSAQLTPNPPLARTTTGGNDRAGWYGGISLGYFHYSTHWYYYGGSGFSNYDNYAVHGISRTVVSLNLEKKALLTRERFQLDAGGEVFYGLGGKTRATDLSGDNIISSGGWSAGLYPYARAVYIPPTRAGSVSVLPFVSLGPQYMFVHNNGQGSSGAIREYDYDGGWNEGVLLLAASLGIELRLEDFVVTPELRCGLLGWNSTSWAPHGHDVTMNGGPGFLALSVRLSKRF